MDCFGARSRDDRLISFSKASSAAPSARTVGNWQNTRAIRRHGGCRRRLLAEIVDRWRAAEAFVEHVSARPGEGPAGAFAFGSSRGVIEGVLAACGVPARFVTPQSWKRVVGLTLRSNDASRAEAIRRWPGHAALFARVKDDGRAEDALIAVAGLAHNRLVPLHKDYDSFVGCALMLAGSG